MKQKNNNNSNTSLDTKSTKAKYQSVYRTAKILICLSNGINNLTDIATHCEINTSTAFRLLKSLEEVDMVVRSPFGRRFFLGPLLSKITANPRITHELLVSLATNEMERLSKLSEETVSLDIAIGIRSIPLFSISGEHALRVVNDRQESTNILPLGATCKILLSQFSEEELETVLRNIRLNSLIHNYAANKELIIGELNRIKKQGYTVSHGERVIGALGISVPITNYDCPVSLSIVGYDFRLLPKVSEFVEELKMSADRISKNILEFIPKSNAEKDQNQSV